MNDIAQQAATKEAVKAKFRGNTHLKAKGIPLYPHSAEREYQRITNAYMKILNDLLKEYLPQIRDAAKREKEKNARYDDVEDLISVARQVFSQIGVELEKNIERFGLRERIEKIANMTRKATIREWKKVVHDTLGVDLLDDYYMGEFYRESLGRWIDKNVDLIKSIPSDTLREMSQIVSDGFLSGKTTTYIMKTIQKRYGVNKRRARLIARDQISNLNRNISQQQQIDAGCEEYELSTSGDSRVRESHRQLNHKRFRWDSPPVVDAKTGRRCHPGEDYQCRCVALPVFDIDTVNVPFTEKGGGSMKK